MIKLPQKLHGSRWETGALTNIETGIAGVKRSVRPDVRPDVRPLHRLSFTRAVTPVNRSRALTPSIVLAIHRAPENTDSAQKTSILVESNVVPKARRLSGGLVRVASRPSIGQRDWLEYV